MNRLTIIATLAAIFIAMPLAGSAQEQPQTFEVVSIKPSKSNVSPSFHKDPVLATWPSSSLSALIEQAYRLQADEIIGGPSWLKSDRWDVVGKCDPPAAWPQQRKMLQPMLADRFKLKVHWETRQRREYELVVAKGGPKVPEGSGDGRTSIGRGLIDGHGISAEVFTYFLRSELGRPVVDHTGLKGKYDFKLQWVPDESQPNSGGDSPPSDATGPTIFAAIQELGFKLKPITGQGQVLVIDHAEKPSEN